VSPLVFTKPQDCWSSVLRLAPDRHASSGKAVKLNSVQLLLSIQAFFGLLLLEFHVMIMMLLMMLSQAKRVFQWSCMMI